MGVRFPPRVHTISIMNFIKSLALSAFLFIPILVCAQKFKYQGYSGGMMVHTGHVKSKEFIISSLGGEQNTHQIKGMPTGIGGVVKLHFGTELNQLRLGSGGYATNVKYEPGHSYASNSFIYFETEYARCFRRFNLISGLDIGGGSVANHLISEANVEDFVEDSGFAYRESSYAAIHAYVGVELKVTERINLLIKTDYPLVLSSQPDYAQGPRIYIGFLFGH